MSLLSDLSESEIEDRFYTQGERPVKFMLARLGEARTAFTVRIAGTEQGFTTLLLGVHPEQPMFYFDCSGSRELNRHFLHAEDDLIFIGRPEGIHVQFRCESAHEVLLGGAQAFAAPLPERILRLQRRECFRISLPLSQPLQFHGRLPDGSLLSLPAHDLSLNGIGLSLTEEMAGLENGLHLSRCHLTLPGESKLLFIEDARLCHHTELPPSRTGHRHWRVGLCWGELPHADENRLQRFIARIEHERREHS